VSARAPAMRFVAPIYVQSELFSYVPYFLEYMPRLVYFFAERFMEFVCQQVIQMSMETDNGKELWREKVYFAL
jgi:hypothetical protein